MEPTTAPTTAPSPAPETDREVLLTSLLQVVAAKGDFPAVGRFLSEVTTAMRLPNSSAQHIASLVLKDFALTNALLRTVNSAFYQSAAGRRVSTISHAVLLLGVDTVANLAIGLSLFEHFKKSDIRAVKTLTVHSLLTGVHARELARSVPGITPEEAFIAGMMHDLGALSAAFYFPEQWTRVEQLRHQAGIDLQEAAERTFGVTMSELGQAVAHAWQFPEHIREAITGLPVGEPVGSPTASQRLRACVSYASELVAVVPLPPGEERQQQLAAIRERYGVFVPLKPAQLDHALATAAQRLDDLMSVLHITAREFAAQLPSATPDRTADATGPEAATAPPAAVPSGATPAPTGDSLLLRTLEEIADALTRDYPLNDVLMMILEGMYRGIGFDHVVLALITPQRDLLRGRFALGVRANDTLPLVKLPLGADGGVFAEVISKQREVLVTDAGDPTQVAGVPTTFLDLFDSQACCLLPIVIQNAAIGAFYVGRSPGRPPISEAELRNLRVLRNDAVLAVRLCRGN